MKTEATNTMFEAATRVGLAYGLALIALTALMLIV